MSADANPSGDIFGGWVLSQMDIAGGIHARQHSQRRVATVAVEVMHFIKPVYVGDVLCVYAAPERVGRVEILRRRFEDRTARDAHAWRKHLTGERRIRRPNKD